MTGKLLVQLVIEGEKGGSGSGNWGHSGRAGKLGGSAPKGVAGAGVGNDITSATAVTLTQQKLANVYRLPDGRYDMRGLGKQGLYGVDTVVSRRAGKKLDTKFIPKYGDTIDYYNKNGDKVYGRVMRVNGSKLTLLDSESKSIVNLTMVDAKTGQEVQ